MQTTVSRFSQEVRSNLQYQGNQNQKKTKKYSYNVGIFCVRIKERNKCSEGVYFCDIDPEKVSPSSIHDISQGIRSQALDVMKREDRILKLDELLRKLKPIIRGYIEKKFSKKEEIHDDLILASSLELLGLGKIAPLLLDGNLEEIFLDSDISRLYVDHAIFGRCMTDIRLSPEEIQILLARASMENDFSLSRMNPSIKADLITPNFHVRISGDISPLAIDGTHLTIRKLRSEGLTLPAMCVNGTLTPLAASFLIFALRNFANITIVGAPSSGKTTLQNALLIFLPLHLRVVTIEDAVETFFSDFQGHMIRFKVDPFEKNLKTTTKSHEVTKLLHRSPDLLCLAEISTSEHAKAWSHAMNAGIPCLQTIHGNNIESLLMRIREIFLISPVLIKTSVPHLLVEMQNIWQGNRRIRRVTRIAEVAQPNLSDDHKTDSEKIHIQDIFSFDPSYQNLVLRVDLWKTFTLREIMKYGTTVRASFEHWIEKSQEFLLTNENIHSTQVPQAFQNSINNMEIL